MDLSVLALIVSILVGIGTIATIIWRGGGMAGSLNELKERHKNCPVGTLQFEFKELKAKQDIFWKIIEPHLAGIIHSPTHPRRDELVQKLVEKRIELYELRELIPLLEYEANNSVAEKKLSAVFLLARTQMLLIDRG